MVIYAVPGQLFCLAILMERQCKIVKLWMTEEAVTDCERRADNQVLDHQEGKIWRHKLRDILDVIKQA